MRELLFSEFGSMYVESPIRGPASAVVVGCKFCNRQSSSSWRMCPKTRALSVCQGTMHPNSVLMIL